MSQYYIYIYLDTRKPGKYTYGDIELKFEPFYVGKGKNKRYLKHLDYAYNNHDKDDPSVNTLKCRKIRKIRYETGNDPEILKVKFFDSEIETFEFEKNLIKQIGKIVDGTGPLTNISDSPVWGSGEKHPCYKKLTESQISTIINLYENEKMYIAHIAEQVNFGEIKVKNVLMQNKIEIRKRKPTNFIEMEDWQKDQAIEDYKNQLSIRAISIKYKLPFEKIRKIINNEGLTRRNGFKRTEEHLRNQTSPRKNKYKGENNALYKKLSEEENKLLKRLFIEEKKSILDISKQMNYSKGKITKELVNMGLFSVKSRC